MEKPPEKKQQLKVIDNRLQKAQVRPGSKREKGHNHRLKKMISRMIICARPRDWPKSGFLNLAGRKK
jgi:hypothetical protein